jgi:hypothetical protein
MDWEKRRGGLWRADYEIMRQTKNKKEKVNFPTLEDVRLGVEELLKENWSNIKFKTSSKLYFKKLEKLFLKNIKLLPFAILQSDTDQLNPPCYRVRKLDSTMDPNIISEFSYRPKHLCKDFQRANLPKNPVFYCSPDAKTAFIETLRNNYNPNDKNIFFISEWLFRPSQKLNVTPFIYGNTSDQNTFKPIGDKILNRLHDEYYELTDEQITVFKEILTFLAGLFVYENTYVISSFIAHSYFYTLSTFRPDIFIYPSIQTDRHTVNFAIHPNTATEKMILNRVFCVKINDFQFESHTTIAKLDFKLIKTGGNTSGIINWKDIDKETFKDFQKMFPDTSAGGSEIVEGIM